MYNILILTERPTEEYEILCFNTLILYSNTNEYDLMFRDNYEYDKKYDYIFYISNNCLILDTNIKIENYINNRDIIQTYSNFVEKNINNFLIIKNVSNINYLLYDIENISDYEYVVNKKINFLSFTKLYNYKNNYKSENFLKELNNPFFFVYGDYEKENKYISLNNVMLNYLYNQLFSVFYYNKDYIDINIDFNKYEYYKEIEVFNPDKKIAFVTLCTPEMKEIGVQTEYNIKTYCERNNYTFYIHRKSEFDGKREPLFEKPYILKKYLEKHDYVIWIDADVLCFDMDFQIENILKNNISCYLYKDLDQYFNTGFIIFKNDEISKNIINDWISEMERINDYTRGDTTGDQYILIDIISSKYLKDVYVNKDMEINVPITLLNKKTKFIHVMSIWYFFRLIIIEYLNYVIFNIKYKDKI